MTAGLLKKRGSTSYSDPYQTSEGFFIHFAGHYIHNIPIICFNNTTQYTAQIPTHSIDIFSDKDLTHFAMLVSEKSLQKEWENEDDNHWASFLKD